MRYCVFWALLSSIRPTISVYRPRIFKMWCGFCSLFIIWIIFIIWSENIMKSICVLASGTLMLVQCPKSRQNSLKPWFKKHAAIRTPLSSFRDFTNGDTDGYEPGKCSIAPGSAILLRTAWARGSALLCAHNTYSALVNTFSHLTYRALRRLF